VLEIAFANRSLRQLCENEITAQRQFGEQAAKRLRQRLADLRAARSAKDIVIGRLKRHEAAKPAEITMELCDGCGLSFCPNHNSVPELPSGCVDWARVIRIKLLRIEK
jgi:plasmid maintenance system killer protein